MLIKDDIGDILILPNEHRYFLQIVFLLLNSYINQKKNLLLKVIS